MKINNNAETRTATVAAAFLETMAEVALIVGFPAAIIYLSLV